MYKRQAFHFRVREEVLTNGAGWGVGELIDEKMIANQQGILHGSGGDDEGLHQRGSAEQEQENGDGPFGDGMARRFLFLLQENLLPQGEFQRGGAGGVRPLIFFEGHRYLPILTN